MMNAVLDFLSTLFCKQRCVQLSWASADGRHRTNTNFKQRGRKQVFRKMIGKKKLFELPAEGHNLADPTATLQKEMHVVGVVAAGPLAGQGNWTFSIPTWPGRSCGPSREIQVTSIRRETTTEEYVEYVDPSSVDHGESW